ncbi:MAG: hypothetical protein H8E16_21595 [Flavobacteriales bacterium]|nr:hypothetical protein [Flavobacteriales bacterium]
MFDPFEEYVNFDQLDILEDLLTTGRYNFYIGVDELRELEKEYFDDGNLTKDRADEIISQLKNSLIESDLDKQFNRINL